MKTSVIIPTFRRPKTLLQALASLQEQSAADFEILVMDNAAEPPIERAVAQFNSGARVKARYIPEPRLGVHYARNHAAEMARGDLLLYTDDDMSFHPCWVEAFQQAFRENPNMVAAGGPVRPVWDEPPPQWLLDFMGNEKMFPVLSLMEPHSTFQLSRDGFYFSCNMALWKHSLVAFGGFHPENTAGKWIGDGETGLNKKMWAKGCLIGYVPEALNYHHIPSSRMTVDYFCRRWANEGACDMYSLMHTGLPTNFGMFCQIARIVRHHWRTWVAALRLRGRTDRSSLGIQMAAARTQEQFRYVLRLLLSPQFRTMVTKDDWLKQSDFS